MSGVMRAVRRNNLTGSFTWIGSDGWAGRSLVSEGSEPEVEGTLSVLPQAHPVKGFDQYFLSLTPNNNKRNPWFIGKHQSYTTFIEEIVFEKRSKKFHRVIINVFNQILLNGGKILSLIAYLMGKRERERKQIDGK